MECSELQQLEKQQKNAMGEYSYYAYAENKILRQMSDRQSKQFAKAAQEKLSDLTRQIVRHQETCSVCNAFLK